MARIVNRKAAPARVGPKFGPYHLPLRRAISRMRREHRRMGSDAYVRRHFFASVPSD